jgi:hypothetical protein
VWSCPHHHLLSRLGMRGDIPPLSHMPTLSAKRQLYVTRTTADSLKQRPTQLRLERDRCINKLLDSIITETHLILCTYFDQIQEAARRKEATPVTNTAHRTN